MVEKDDEPPHDLDHDAKDIALLIGSALDSNIFSEIHVMRKTVVDGSNTSGFQRTMLIAQGGHVEVEGKQVGVQSICLEEDAAKIIKDEDNKRFFSLDRLGVPLVEIALEPVSDSPKTVRNIALSLGRLLRVTKRVARGIGTIRQDVNISIDGGGIIEVKGVQQLDQLEKIIEFEATRQHGLKIISDKIKEKEIALEAINKISDVFPVTELLKDCNSKIIKDSLQNKNQIKAIRMKKFGGLIGFEPYPDIRLGKEIGQLVRFFGIGGVFHSDELPNYGIDDSDIYKIRNLLTLDENDAFLIIAGNIPSLDFAVESIINRINDARNGPPAETRAATTTGETVFLRPRPGASRMYPETDIPTIQITKDEIDLAKSKVPKPWAESLLDIQNKYKINAQLSEQIFDSEYFTLFEKICGDGKSSPNFVASVLCSTITNLQRKGLNAKLLKPDEISNTFELLKKKEITKESIEIVFEQIMSGKVLTALDAVEKASITQLSQSDLEKILDEIIEKNYDKIKEDGMRSVSAIMGVVMKEVRGKTSGSLVNELTTKKIKAIIK